jgi:hypothetical protein
MGSRLFGDTVSTSEVVRFEVLTAVEEENDLLGCNAMRHLVRWKSTNVSEEHTASICEISD